MNIGDFDRRTIRRWGLASMVLLACLPQTGCLVLNLGGMAAERITADRSLAENITTARFAPSGRDILLTIRQGQYMQGRSF